MVNFFEYFRILSILILFPIFGIFFILPIKKEICFQEIKNIKNVALLISIVHLFIFIIIILSFNHNNFTFQFSEYIPFIRFNNINYNIGINKISIWFVLISMVFSNVSVIISFNKMNINLKNYLILIFLINSSVIGFLLSIDIIIFYIFFEISYLFFTILLFQNVFTNDKLIKLKIFKGYFFSSLFFLFFILYLISEYDSTTIEIIHYKILNSQNSFFTNLFVLIFFLFRSGVFYFFNLRKLIFYEGYEIEKIIFSSIFSILPVYGISQFFKYNKNIKHQIVIAISFFLINLFSINNLKKNINDNKFFETKNLEEITKFFILYSLGNVFLNQENFQINFIIVTLNQSFLIFFLIILFDNKLYEKLFFRKFYFKIISFYIFSSLIFIPIITSFKKIYSIEFSLIFKNNFIQFLFNYFSSIYIFIYLFKILNKKNLINREKFFIKNSTENSNNLILNLFVYLILFLYIFLFFYLIVI